MNGFCHLRTVAVRITYEVYGSGASMSGKDQKPGAAGKASGERTTLVAPAAAGLAVIRNCMKTLPTRPGVYRMIGAGDKVLYVGKAKNLAKRVASYTHFAKLPRRLQRMVAETMAMEIVTTHTEVEALLLESNLIKRLTPRYNVLLRDDKSFPYIFIVGDHDFPQICKHRGARSRKGEYFGPFASAGAVNETLNILARVFLLRNCDDSVFTARSRPCLLYQIKRCSAPCVGRIDAGAYAELVAQAKDFLSGRSRDVQKRLAVSMQKASKALNYEMAAAYRDRIRALSQVQLHQDINVAVLGDAEVIAIHQVGGRSCIQVFFFRGGRNYGNRSYFPYHDANLAAEEILGPFITQFYESRIAPPSILLSHDVADHRLIEQALTLRAGHKVVLARPRRGAKFKLMGHALINAEEALSRRLAESASQRQLLERVARVFGLDAPPNRIEVYDNSHIQGTKPVGAMVVAGPDGLNKKAYRTFNIKGGNIKGVDMKKSGTVEDTSGTTSLISPGDDYTMMREVLTRRFTRALKEDPAREKEDWPDLLLIDGGAGHLAVTCQVMADLGLGSIPVVAIAKGLDRCAGRERFFLPGGEPFGLKSRDPVLFFLQRLRDEAHRFAIGSHRRKRSAALSRSTLDEIVGVGAVRKKALLQHFGSARDVARAGFKDLEVVSGISRTVAKKIYDHFHDDG